MLNRVFFAPLGGATTLGNANWGLWRAQANGRRTMQLVGKTDLVVVCHQADRRAKKLLLAAGRHSLCAPVLGGRFASVAFRGQNVSQIAMRFGEAGLQADRHFEFVLRTIDGAGREQEQAEAVMGLCVSGIGSDCLLEVVRGLRVVAVRREQVGEIVMRLRVVGL